jgi:hypothetical protein
MQRLRRTYKNLLICSIICCCDDPSLALFATQKNALEKDGKVVLHYHIKKNGKVGVIFFFSVG